MNKYFNYFYILILFLAASSVPLLAGDPDMPMGGELIRGHVTDAPIQGPNPKTGDGGSLFYPLADFFINFGKYANNYNLLKFIPESLSIPFTKHVLMLLISAVTTIALSIFATRRYRNNINITSLFENELKKRSGYHLAIEGLLNFRFLKRLKKAKIDIKVLLDWWESQASDKGLHRGMKVFFPHSNVIGYLGYAPRNMELQLLPSIHETNNFLVPKYIAVIGRGLIKNLKFLNPEQNVISAPAFRYQYLWNNYNKINKTPVFNILVALPITFEDTIHILNVVKKYFDIENKKNCNILIKLHPTMSKNMLQRKFNYKFPKEFKLIFGSAKDYMLTANVIISSMSIVCLESLALGIPVILVKRPHGLNFNPIPHEIKEDLWKQCVNEIDILSAINNFKNRDNFEIKRHNKIASEIRKNYFEPITRKGIANLLDLN